MEGEGRAVVVLRGLTTGLAAAEAAALGMRVIERRGRLLLGEAPPMVHAAGIDAVMDGGGMDGWTGHEEALNQIMSELRFPQGPIAVRVHRLGGKVEGCSTQALAKDLGGRLMQRGASIDLTAPAHVLDVHIDASGPHLGWGWRRHVDHDGIGARRPGERPFFRPVSLDPHLARTAVNLALGVRSGVLLDAMTGTGGFLIEAALSGRESVALDLDPRMVEGASTNLAWATQPVTSAHAIVVEGDATDLENTLPSSALGRIAGLVLDPPYGRNSHGSHGPWDLLARVLASTAGQVGPEGAGCCLILPIHPLDIDLNEGAVDPAVEVDLLHGSWQDVLDLFAASAWTLDPRRWSVKVHGSLGRLILLAACAPQG
jgi:putative methyltransferase (TIGR01177 family)